MSTGPTDLPDLPDLPEGSGLDADPVGADPFDREAMPAEMADEMNELVAAHRNLSRDVQGLDATFQALAGIQREQRIQREKQVTMERQAVIDRSETQKKINRSRRVTSGVALALAVILPVVSILIYLVLVNNVNTLLRKQRAGSYGTCMTRNQSNLDNADRERRLAAVEPDLKVKRIHEESAADLMKSIIDCTTYLRPPKPNP